jgi:hypothetical protein
MPTVSPDVPRLAESNPAFIHFRAGDSHPSEPMETVTAPTGCGRKACSYVCSETSRGEHVQPTISMPRHQAVFQ